MNSLAKWLSSGPTGNFFARNAVVLSFVSVICFSPPLPVQGQTALLFDNFDDNSLDGSKWFTKTAPQFSWGGRSVQEVGGAVEFKNKGFLVTQQQWDPVAVGGLRITGIWRPKSFNDVLNVHTRANAVETVNFLNNDQGIRFAMFAGGGNGFLLLERLAGGSSNTTGGAIDFKTLQIDPGDEFLFEVIDDGFNLSFTVIEIGGDLVMESLAGTDGTDHAVDHVLFNNRENGYTACLDDVLIESLALTTEEAIASLQQDLLDLQLLNGKTNIVDQLDHRLDKVLKELADGDAGKAIKELEKFIHRVEKERDKGISNLDADGLIEAADELILMIEAG